MEPFQTTGFGLGQVPPSPNPTPTPVPQTNPRLAELQKYLLQLPPESLQALRTQILNAPPEARPQILGQTLAQVPGGPQALAGAMAEVGAVPPTGGGPPGQPPVGGGPPGQPPAQPPGGAGAGVAAPTGTTAQGPFMQDTQPQPLAAPPGGVPLGGITDVWNPETRAAMDPALEWQIQQEMNQAIQNLPPDQERGGRRQAIYDVLRRRGLVGAQPTPQNPPPPSLTGARATPTTTTPAAASLTTAPAAQGMSTNFSTAPAASGMTNIAPDRGLQTGGPRPRPNRPRPKIGRPGEMAAYREQARQKRNTASMSAGLQTAGYKGPKATIKPPPPSGASIRATGGEQMDESGERRKRRKMFYA